MNLYEHRPRCVRLRRAYMVEAECRVRVGFHARDTEEAEDFFNEFSAAVEDRFPGIVLSVTDVYEDE